MTLMHNPFMEQEETLFIIYDEIIRNPYPLLLKHIADTYYDTYKDFLDMDKIKGMDMPNLTRLCVQRTDKNILKAFAKTEFDYHGALIDLKNKFLNIYELCELISIGKNLQMILSQKFTKKIYVYTEEYDVRVHADLQSTYNDMNRVNYVYGNYEEAIEKLNGITTYIVNDIEYIPPIFENAKASYTSIIMAMYGYNYTLDDKGNPVPKLPIESEYMKGVITKFATFMPIEMTPAHFSKVQLP